MQRIDIEKIIYKATAQGQVSALTTLDNKYQYTTYTPDDNGDAPLHIAVTKNDPALITALKYADPNQKNINKDKTPFEQAIDEKKWSCVLAMSGRENLNLDTVKYAIYNALRDGKIDVVRALVQTFPVTNYALAEAEYAIYKAVREEKVDEVHTLTQTLRIAHYALAEQDPKKETPVHIAVTMNNPAMLTALNCPDISQKNVDGKNPLIQAIEEKKLECVAAIVKCITSNKEILELYKEALKLAADTNQPDIIKILLDAGAHYATDDVYKNSPAITVLSKEHWRPCIDQFLSRPPKDSHEELILGTVLVIICEKDNTQDKIIYVKKLIENNALKRLVPITPNSNSALHEAIRYNDTELMLLLKQNNTFIQYKNKDGYTPLAYAAQNKRWEMAKTLAAADSKNIEQLNYALCFAAMEESQVDFADFLLKQGADMSAVLPTDPDENNALHLATRHAGPKMLTLFLRHPSSEVAMKKENKNKLLPSQLSPQSTINKCILFPLYKSPDANDSYGYGDLILRSAELNYPLLCWQALRAGGPTNWYFIDDNRTALHCASTSNSYTVSALLHFKANPDALTKEDKKTPMALAAEKSMWACVNALSENPNTRFHSLARAKLILINLARHHTDLEKIKQDQHEIGTFKIPKEIIWRIFREAFLDITTKIDNSKILDLMETAKFIDDANQYKVGLRIAEEKLSEEKKAQEDTIKKLQSYLEKSKEFCQLYSGNSLIVWGRWTKLTSESKTLITSLNEAIRANLELVDTCARIKLLIDDYVNSKTNQESGTLKMLAQYGLYTPKQAASTTATLHTSPGI